MDTIAAVRIVEVLGLAGLCIWLFRLIGAQKTVVDTLRSHSAFVRDLQDTVSRLYQPQEIENLVNAKVAIAQQDYETRIENLEQNLQNASQASDAFVSRYKVTYTLCYLSLFYLDQNQIEDILSMTTSMEDGPEIRGWVEQRLAEIEADKRRALERTRQDRS